MKFVNILLLFLFLFFTVSPVFGQAAAPVMGLPDATAPVLPTADAADQSLQMPAPPAEAAPATAPTPIVTAVALTGEDILQLTEEAQKVGLVQNDNPQIRTIFDNSDKLNKDRTILIASMAQTATALKNKFIDQKTKLDDFYQSFSSEEGKIEELFSPLEKQKAQ